MMRVETQGSEADANDVILDDGDIAVQGFEVAGLAGIDDFGTIYSWASRVARRIGKAIQKPGRTPVRLAPTAFAVEGKIGVFGKNPLPAGRGLLPGMPPDVVGQFPHRGAPASFSRRMDAFGLGGLDAPASNASMQRMIRTNVDLAKRIGRVVSQHGKLPPATLMRIARQSMDVTRHAIARRRAGVPGSSVGAFGLITRKSATPKKSWGASIMDRIRSKKTNAIQRAVLFAKRAGQANLVKARAKAAAQSATVQQQTTADPNVAQAAEIARRQAEDDARRAEQLQKEAEARAQAEADIAAKAANIEQKAAEAAASAATAEKAAAAAQEAADLIQQSGETQTGDRTNRRPRRDRARRHVPQEAAAEEAPSAEYEGQAATEEAGNGDEPIPEEYAEPEAVAEPERAEPSSEEEAQDEESEAYLQGLGVLLGTDAQQAKAVTKAFSRAYVGFIPPGALLTKAGAARVGVAGARAAAASKLYTAKADLTEKMLTKVARQGDALPKGSADRKRKQVHFSLLTRELLANRAQAERARVIASGITATLRFRKQAQAAAKSGKTGEAKQKLGQAAAAITVTQGFAQTPVRVALPPEISQTTTNALAKEVGMAPPIPEPSKEVKVESPLPKTAAPAARAHYAQRAKVPKQITPKGHSAMPKHRSGPARGLPRPPLSNYLRDPDQRRMEAAVSLRAEGLGGGPYSRVATTFRSGGADGLGSIDGFFSFLKPVADFAKKVIPSHTIVGKLLNGKTGEAAVSAVKLATGQKPAKAPATPASAMPQNAADASIAQAVMQSFQPQTQMQTGLLIGAGVLSVGLIAMLAFRSRAQTTS